MKRAEQTKRTGDASSFSKSRERELMADIAGGSEAAFQELVTAVHPLILSVVRRTIGNASDLDDVCQTVLLAVWNGAAKWAPEKGRVSSWIATIARNRAIDHVRKMSRAAAMRVRLTSETAAHAAAGFDFATDDEFLRMEVQRVTHRALGELAPDQRQLLELAFLEGLTQAEVAERTGLPLGTAKARIRRGIMTLRRRLPRRLAA